MFTSPTATRDQALKAAAAAERAMERQTCCKSQFKFKCFSCGEFINPGDKITKCTAPCWDGMRLRFRGADARNGLTMEETAFYLAETGTRTWVHIGCNPCYWDSLPEDSNEYSPPALRSVYTDWGAKVSYEFDEWRQRTNHYDMEEFLEKHGYPQEKWMKDRIIHSVTRFQAIWRGHLYKKAYPLALAQRRAKELTIWREFLTWCGSLPPQQFRSFPLFCKLKGIHTVYSGIQLGRYAAAAAAEPATAEAEEELGLMSRVGAMLYDRSKWLWSGEGGCDADEEEEETALAYHKVWHSRRVSTECQHCKEEEQEEDAPASSSLTARPRTRAAARNAFLHNNCFGAHFEILMDRNHPSAAIYSAEVIKIQGQGFDGLYYWVKFHHDGEVRRYHWKKLLKLKRECETFKSKHKIQAKLTGKLPLYKFIYP